jgi:hypothetical protein
MESHLDEEQQPIQSDQKLPLFQVPESDRPPNCYPDEYLDLEEVDAIFSTSYEMMIKEAFRDNKHFILAKIQTRSLTSYVQSHSHFFNAYGIMKLIFKKKRDEFVGRFHHQFPITAKNPLTNNVSLT